MARAVLIHWKPAEAEERSAALRDAGWDVEVLAPEGSTGLREVAVRPPDAFVIDLDRIPSHGRAVALELRRRKGTRAVPLVFAGGAPDKVAGTRALLPDACYTAWSGIAAALVEAGNHRPAAPLAPPAMACYSGTPLAKKLGIREGSTVALLGAPVGFEGKLAGLPEGVHILRRAPSAARTILLFTASRNALARRFPAAVRAFGLEAGGFVDYKICAVDETWSGLLFARRRKLE